jgi:hypothetical protein
MDTICEALGVIILFAVVVLLVGVLVGFPVMWLWNWLMPVIFGLTKINFWQAWGLSVLCSLLFKKSSASNELSKK